MGAGSCPLPADVVRVEKDGAALMFRGLDQHVYNILVDISLAYSALKTV